MKPKMLLVYAAFKGQVYKLAHYLEKYYDVEVSHAWYLQDTDEPPFEIDLPKVKYIPFNTALNTDREYDVCLGYDPSALPCLLAMREVKGCKVGCTVLDVPIFTRRVDRNFNPSLNKRWETWQEQFNKMDFVVSWRRYTETMFEPPQLILFAPTEPPDYEQYKGEKLNQVCYSGVIRPDKGVHNIIEALSLMEESPKLVVVGYGKDLSDYAAYLKVPYTQIRCSEKEKYTIYEAGFTVVSYSDSGYIPPLSPLEAMSIGVIPVVPYYDEYEYLYGDIPEYADPNHPEDLARVLERVRDTNYHWNTRAKCMRFAEKRTHTAYVESLKEFIDGIM